MYWCLRLERGIYAWQVTLDEFLPWLGNAGLLSEALRRKPASEGELLRLSLRSLFARACRTEFRSDGLPCSKPLPFQNVSRRAFDR